MRIEIMDTTLRDGEQTSGVSFMPHEKLAIARCLLESVRVDRIEVASARVSDGERRAVSLICRWAEGAGLIDRVEVLGFVDGRESVDWIQSCGGQVMNLLTKGSERHCTLQLRKTPQEHIDDIRRTLDYARRQGVKTNVYLEDWSNGMADSFPYVFAFLRRLSEMEIERVMLPDTLGILTPEQVSRYLDWVYSAAPDLRVDFHGHNDYGLVTANSLAAVKAGVSGIHVTVNGLGERTGNQSLAQLVVAINDHTDRKTRVVEKELLHASEIVQTISGKRYAWNAPVVGSDVFTQTCGVHADGDRKGNLYANRLLPERFGRKRDYALGKLSGKASLDQNLQAIGMAELEPGVRAKVLQEIVRLGDKKKQVSAADLPFIIASVLRTPISGRVRVVDYQIETRMNVLPKALVKIELDGKPFSEKSSGDGGYDAFVKALRKLLRKQGITFPRLADYQVRIPPGGKTDALVETTISWELPDNKKLTTTGVDSDQIAAAIVATEKMLNLVIQ